MLCAHLLGCALKRTTGARRGDRAVARGRRRTPKAVLDAAAQGAAAQGAAAQGAGLAPPVWGLFPVDLEAPVRVAAGVQSAGSAPGSVVEHLPASLAAVATHIGPYEHLALTYQAVFAWIHERGLRPRGTVAEAYLADPTTSDPAQLVTRIVIPVEDEEQR